MIDLPAIPRIGIVGTGFISRGLGQLLLRNPYFKLSRVLTRRPLADVDYPATEVLTHSIDDLLENSDIIVECSGHVLHATQVCNQAIEAGKPVVTMNSEFQVTTGSYFVDKGIITEAEGDQPGCLAALKENLEIGGFEPVIYGNMKGYLNHTPSLEDMIYWARKQGISLQQVISYTDGTKLQIEQTFVGNAFQANIVTPGLAGPSCNSLEEGVETLLDLLPQTSPPISDYLLGSNLPKGVFIVARATDDFHQDALRYLRMGDGPYYTFLLPYHLVYMEIPRTLKRIALTNTPLMNNGTTPHLSVAAITKRALGKGELIPHGIGSFDVRGVAVYLEEHPNHVPIGLLYHARIRQSVEPGQILTFSDVELPESLALDAWQTIRKRVLTRTSARA